MLSEPAAIQGSARIEALNPAHEKVGAVLKLKKKGKHHQWWNLLYAVA